MNRLFTIGLLLAAALVPGGFARAADPQPYTVNIVSTGAADLDATLQGSAQLVTLKDKVAIPPFALIERARSDVPRLQTALDSFGYYANKVTITIGGHALTDPALPGYLDSLATGTAASVNVAIDKGPLYRLGDVTVEGTLPDKDRAALGIKSGDPAIAGNVLDAQTKLLNALQEDGYALAKVDAPIAYADDEKHLLNVTFHVEAGAKARIGEITFKGLKDVNEAFARRALTIKPGDTYAPSKIETARQALMAQGVFTGVSVRAADHLTPDGRIALVFDVQERKRHAVALTAAYSTDLGISLSATWSHRNLFGNAEQLNLTAAGTGLGSSTTGLGYKLSAQFIKPLFLRNDQTLELDISGVKQNLDAYSQKAETAAAFLRRKFTPQWSGTLGLSYSHDNVSQEGTDRLYQLVALPITVSYDSTGLIDILQDPLKGIRASAAVTPTKSFGASDLTFFVLQASASTYFDLSGDGRSVLALRGLAGSILGGANLELPPDQRLYAGGSATVRGFAYQSIGPQFADGNPIGAKSVDAGTIEFRQRIGDDWGGAVFVDAGQASANGAPFNGAVRVGAGIGARYYTALGPVRLDVAVPLTRVHGGDAFEVYIGLGQAF
ncbi:MAG: autotransporter assembly complex protein TamA [Rhizomicrobium sp.]